MAAGIITEERALALLRKHARRQSDPGAYRIILKHARAVQTVAMRIARRIAKRRKVDLEFVRTAALLHDIGRFRCPPRTGGSIRHGVVGAEIMREEGLERYARVCERHLGAGITVADIERQGLPLPKRPYVPRTVEEKIVTMADNLIIDSREAPLRNVLDRYERELGYAYAKRIKRLDASLRKLMR
ncbi:HD domain-containing protein [Candidatus Woesearchaeota archaeon]|nr:HD domain-containing protein [Candidatus Woesearchaeota archaeon]